MAPGPRQETSPALPGVAVAAAVVLAGCLGGLAPDASPAPAGAVAPTLPADLAIDGAELLERNATFARFAWRGTAPPGAEYVGPAASPADPPTLVVPMPAGAPVAFFAGLRYDGRNALDVEVVDPAGGVVCRSDLPGSVAGRTWETCGLAVAPLASAQTWTLRVVSYTAPPPGIPFELDIRYRVDARVLELAAPGDPAPDCEPDRRPVQHRAAAAPTQEATSDWIVCATVAGTGAYNPTVGIGPDGTAFVASLSDPRRQTQPIGLARSTDEGATWEPIVPTFAGRPAHPLRYTPYLHVDSSTGRVFFHTVCNGLTWSDDAGATWERSAYGCFESQSTTIFTGPPRTSATTGYPNVVYRCGMQPTISTTTCAKSLDGGRTWAPTGAPAFGPSLVGGPGDPMTRCAIGASHGHVAADGRVLLPQGVCGTPLLAISEDEGATWRVVRVADLGMPRGPNHFEGQSEAWADEANVGVDAEGTIHYGWIAEDRRPYVTRSKDGGATWSKPLPIAPPGLTETSFGAMAVGGAGQLAFTYLGSENSPGAPWTGDYGATTWNAYLTIVRGADGAAPIVETARLNAAFDPLQKGRCGPMRCQGLGDYLDVQIAPDGAPWAVFADACDAACALYDDGVEGEPRLLVGRLVGGSLWDASDLNGPYPGGS